MTEITSNPEFAIEVTNLCKSFNGKAAVQQVSLKVKQGEIFGFLGPNGGGKTTTIRMLCGLLTPDSGDGHCLGYNILTDTRNIKVHTGYMTQHFSLYDDLTVRENLDFMAHLYEVKDRKEIVDMAIVELGLTQRADQLAGTLSGGWKQRLSLTAALLHKPKLLLLDEPTAGVDPKARREFWDHIHYLATKGITILVSTHYMDEVERCHRLGYVFDGKILVQGTKEEISEYAGLTTWIVSGGDIGSVIENIKTLPGVERVMVFGNSLHVNGKNSKLMQESMTADCLKNYQCLKVAPNLEDIFISLGEHIES